MSICPTASYQEGDGLTVPLGLNLEDVQCPICVETISDPFVTSCGHTFCYNCITTQLKHKKSCPSCSNYLTQDQIYPNFLLNKILQKAAAVTCTHGTSLLDSVQNVLSDSHAKLKVADINLVIDVLFDKRDELERQESSDNLLLLLLFLEHAKAERQAALEDLQHQMLFLQQDLAAATGRLPNLQLTPGLALPPPLLHTMQPPQQQQQQQQRRPKLHVHTVGKDFVSSITVDMHTHGPEAGAQALQSAIQAAASMSRAQSQSLQSSQHDISEVVADSAIGPLQVSNGIGSAALSTQAQADAQQRQQQRLSLAGTNDPQQQSQQAQAAATAQHMMPAGSGAQPSGMPRVASAGHLNLLGMTGITNPFNGQQQAGVAAAAPQPLAGTSTVPPAPAAAMQQTYAGAAGGMTAAQSLAVQQAFAQSYHQQSADNSAAYMQGSLPLPLPLVPGNLPIPGGGAVGHSMSQPAMQQGGQSMAPPHGGGPVPAMGAAGPMSHAAPGQHGPGILPAGAHTHVMAGAGAGAGATGAGLLQPPMQASGSALHMGAVSAASASLLGAGGPGAARAGGPYSVSATTSAPAHARGASSAAEPEDSQAAKKRRIMLSQFDVLEEAYMQMRARRTSYSGSATEGGAVAAASGAGAGLQLPAAGSVSGLPAGAVQVQGTAANGTSRNALADGVPTSVAAGGVDGAAGVRRSSDLHGLGGLSALSDAMAGEGIGTAPAAQQAPNASSFSQLASTLLGKATSAAVGATGAGVAAGADASAVISGGGGVGGEVDGSEPPPPVPLSTFSHMLSTATHYSRMSVLSEIPKAPSASSRPSASILSSIEFDLDDRMFAAAGVTPRILVYDYTVIIAAPRDRHSPVLELPARSKLSCLSYSTANKCQLAASDYEGQVTLWDTAAACQVTDYEAHDRRIWSVDFSPLAQGQFASGSDDGTVKVWSVNSPKSVATLAVRANVCAVEYSPAAPHLLAVGSAAHNVLIYDLRMPTAPVATLEGHRKAVSYVKWLSGSELVSASTDGTLRLWQQGAASATNPAPTGPGGSGAARPSNGGWGVVRTFSGHTNEKHFVGLSVGEDFIACGSETNEVYVYYKAIPRPTMSHSFTTRPDTDAGSFISALCWRNNSSHLLAANSQGHMWVLELQA